MLKCACLINPSDKGLFAAHLAVLVDTYEQIEQIRSAFKGAPMNFVTAEERITEIIKKLGFGTLIQWLPIEGTTQESITLTA